MFDALEAEKPNHFAVRQYKKYKLAAGKTAKSILISCGAVSYTHLDVYKRQKLSMACVSRNRKKPLKLSA